MTSTPAKIFGNAGQSLGENGRIEVVEMQENMVLVLADAAPFANLHRHGARYDVARGQVLGRGGIALHEALAFRIGDIAALAPRALGDEAAGAINAGGVELDELHVLQGQAGAQHHGVAVAGAGMGRGAGKVGAAVTAGGKDDLVGAETVQGTVIHVERHQAAAGAIAVHDQVDGEILDEELGRIAQGLAIERVQDGVAGAVGGGAGALGSGALAISGGHAAKGALIDLAFLGARKRHAEMVELIDRGRSVAAQIFDGVLVAEPVRPLDGVVHMPAPVVLAHIAEGRRNAALGGNGMAARGEDLGDAGGFQPGLAGAEGGTQAGAAGADDNHIESVVDELIGT